MAPARGAWLKARARSNSKAGERRDRCIGPQARRRTTSPRGTCDSGQLEREGGEAAEGRRDKVVRGGGEAAGHDDGDGGSEGEAKIPRPRWGGGATRSNRYFQQHSTAWAARTARMKAAPEKLYAGAMDPKAMNAEAARMPDRPGWL